MAEEQAGAGQDAGGGQQQQQQQQQQATWYAGFDDQTKGYVEAKGLAAKTPAEAFAAAAKAHREAEAYIGAPADQLIRLPKADAPADDWKPVWQRLGAPAAPEGYDFSPAAPEGGQLDAKLVDTLRATAVRNHLPLAAAQDVAKAFVAFQAEQTKVANEDRAALVQQGKEALAKNWGANLDSNLVIARNAANALGVTPEAVAALEQTIGYDKVMELFRSVGTKIGEDKFITGGPGGDGNRPVTQDTAKTRLAELKTDTDWAKRLLSGDSEARKEFDNLSRVAAGV